MFSKIRVSLISCLLAAASASALPFAAAQAAGFYLQEQSVSGLGSAYAGAAAAPRDASIIFYNPAGMTALGQRQVTIGGNLIVPRANFVDRGSDAPGALANGIDLDNPVPAAIVPNMYAAWPINDKVWLGVGVSAPFGLSTVYENDWVGRFDSIKSSLRTLDFQPSIAVAVTDWLSVGGGIDMQQASATLTAAVFDGAEGLSTIKGSDASFGWNAGVLLTPAPDTQIGLHYRASIQQNLSGRAFVTGTAGSNFDLPATADLNLPDIASLGIAHDLTDRWTILGQATWFGWNKFQTIKVVTSSGTVLQNAVQNYQTTMNFALGAEYKWDEATTLCGGYQYDQTPTTSEYRSTRIPDSTRQWITAGASHKLNDGFSIDLGGAWIFMKDAHIDQLRNSNLAHIDLEKTDSSIGILSLGLSYKF